MDSRRIANRIAEEETAVLLQKPQTASNFTVGQLTDLLQKQDQNAPVGVCMSRITGYIQDIDGVKVAKDGTVCIDQADTTVNLDELDFV